MSVSLPLYPHNPTKTDVLFLNQHGSKVDKTAGVLWVC